MNLAFAFLLCALALQRLRRRHSEVPLHSLRRVLSLATIVICVYLLAVVSWPQRFAGGAVIVSGLLVHVLLAPYIVSDALHEGASAEHLPVAWLDQRRVRFLRWLFSALSGRGGASPRYPRGAAAGSVSAASSACASNCSR